jgi:hypothetical protein
LYRIAGNLPASFFFPLFRKSGATKLVAFHKSNHRQECLCYFYRMDALVYGVFVENGILKTSIKTFAINFNEVLSE